MKHRAGIEPFADAHREMTVQRLVHPRADEIVEGRQPDAVRHTSAATTHAVRSRRGSVAIVASLIVASLETVPRRIGRIEILPWDLVLERLWDGDLTR